MVPDAGRSAEALGRERFKAAAAANSKAAVSSPTAQLAGFGMSFEPISE
jgi:hypothetical protein